MKQFFIPLRSGITNTVIWFVVELFLACVIDRLLAIAHGRHLQRSLQRKEAVHVKESSIPLVGAGFLAGCVQSYVLNALRERILLSFLAMNLGIDGTDQPTYGSVVLHSRVKQRSMADGQVVGEYAQMIPEVLYQCMSYNAKVPNSKLTLYEPVFNLTKAGPVSITKLIVQRNGSLCMDGKETERKRQLASGTIYQTGSMLNPMPDGERYFVNSKDGDLGRRQMYPGELVDVSIHRDKNESFQGPVKLERAVCSSWAPSALHGAPNTRTGWAVKCFTVSDDGEDFIFGVHNTWLNNIFGQGNRTLMAMGMMTPAIRLKENKIASRCIHRALAASVLVFRPVHRAEDFAGAVFIFHYTVILGQKPFTVKAKKGLRLETKVSLLAVRHGVDCAYSTDSTPVLNHRCLHVTNAQQHPLKLN